MASIIQSVVLATFILAGIVENATAQDAATILERMDDVLYAAEDLSATNTIILIDKKGNREVREATIKQKGSNRRIMRFTSPASQAGIAVLALPDDVMYLYLPAFGKERRISTSVKNQNFAGTDFSYDDMEPKPYADKYTPTLLKTEGDAFILELTPKGPSDYSKVLVNVNKENYFPEIMEYYDRGNNKIKVAKYSFKKIGKYWNASEIEMTDLKRDHRTIMQMSDIKYDTGIAEDVFTIRKLKQEI